MPSAILFQQLFIDMLVAELLTPARLGAPAPTQPSRCAPYSLSLASAAHGRARSHHLHKTLSISIRKPTSLQRSQHLFHVASTAPGHLRGVTGAARARAYQPASRKAPHTMWLEIDAMSAQQWPCCYVHHSVGGQYTWSRNQTSRAEQLFETVKRQLPEPSDDIFPIYNGFRKVMMEPALTALTLDINGRLHDFAMLPLTTAATLRSLVLNNITLSGFLNAFVETTHAHPECLDIHLIHVSSPAPKTLLDPAIGRAVSLLPAFHASPLHTLRLLNTDASLLPFDQRDFPRLCSLDVALRYLPSHELHTLEGLPQALLAHSNLRYLSTELSATVASDAATEITLAYQIDAGRSSRRLARREVVEMVAGGLGSTPLNMRLQSWAWWQCAMRGCACTCFAEAAEVLRLAARVPSLLCLEMGHGRCCAPAGHLQHLEIKSICVYKGWQPLFSGIYFFLSR
ncbi:hypothetical protein DL89DRAFT_273299 [Linderina pennispora]|uniref:F-box domain-containing protein n=1 Tax=Linderina pennispora TaxID=61395 RepID=A0A1Y1VR46_9FUNG|nr:uncharacterized protein DL89DRAFT_273299 [Linderina pennispora]ORX63525.1 hypothetical protein DL89DRAFT_273299 [Linderina pennispora]